MKFNLVESEYLDWDKIHDEFTDDYLFSCLSNQDLRLKYNLTHRELRECINIVKSEQNISRRPFWKHREGTVKYYYKCDKGFQIRKRINGIDIYLGLVPSEDIAKKVVEKCIKLAWNVG